MSIIARTIKPKARTFRLDRPKAGTRIVVLGNGMVGQKFCEHLAQLKLTNHCSIDVVGDEPQPAYDRIHLSDLASHRDPAKLELKARSWFTENGITLHTGLAATNIDRELKAVHTNGTEVFCYDYLVIATGSRPFVPAPFDQPVPGIHVYRTIKDMEGIISDAEGKSSALIIGGGLLGLEAAQVARDLGMEARIMERSAFLMPQQLNQSAAQRLDQTVREKGIKINYLKASKTLKQEEDGKLTVGFQDKTSATADMIMVATGIVPATAFLKESGIKLGMRGGIIVDDFLTSSDPSIFAIGECAQLHGRIYGLAAPGYAMAALLAEIIAGKTVESLPPPDLSTRLKMAGADVVSIGSPLQQGTTIEFSSASSYRLICYNHKHKLVGALGVGEWPEAGEIQSLFLGKIRIPKKQLLEFANTGQLVVEQPSIDAWPDDRIVCNCLTVRKGEIMECMTKCGADPDLVAKGCGASTVCGSCRPLIEKLCNPEAETSRPIAYRSLISASAIALIAVLLTIFLAPPAMASSVESWWYKIDEIWRDNLIKQITGYSLLALCLVGLLLSLRKRFKWFRFGHFAKWRVFHAVFGVIALIVLFAHTGFRFGDNLNFWLMFSFVGLNLLGALAGIISALESKGSEDLALRARRIRPALTYAHFVLFWPLPALLVFHILSVYLY
ncbi:MAG: FAD-dependent oxidoreductase [Luteolibacter sp.]